jgi:transposase-like protein
MMVSFKGAHFMKDIILTGVRWYEAYPLSDRQVEEVMQARGVPVDYATITHGVLKYAPPLEKAFHCRNRPSGTAGAWTRHTADEGTMALPLLCRRSDGADYPFPLHGAAR